MNLVMVLAFLVGGCLASGCGGSRGIGVGSPYSGGSTTAAVSVQPVVDEQNFAAFADMIANAEDFIAIAMFVTDEATVLTGRQVHVADHGVFSCSQPPPSKTAIFHLRCRAAEMARLAATRLARTGGNPRLARGNVRVIAFDIPVEDSFDTPEVDVGDLAVVPVDPATLRTWGTTGRRVIKELRNRGSGESEAILLDLRDRFLRLRNPPPVLYFPSGIYVVEQSAASLIGSFHMKALVTERAGYVGGVDIFKDNWDTGGHPHTSNDRLSSARRASRGPFHDTGAIVRGSAVRELQLVLEERWLDALHRGSHPYGRLLALLARQAAVSSQHDASILLGAKQLLDREGAGLAGRWLVPPLASQADGRFLASHAEFQFSLPSGAVTHRLHPTSAYPGAPYDQGIRDEYFSAFGGAIEPNSYVYLENQYFRDPDVAVSLFKAAESVGQGWNRDRFAAVVIPHTPEGVYGPWDYLYFRKHFIKGEMKALKWLELKTPRFVKVRCPRRVPSSTPLPPPGPFAPMPACPQPPTANDWEWQVVGSMFGRLDPHCAFPLSGPYVRFSSNSAANSRPETLEIDDELEMVLWEYDAYERPKTYVQQCGPNCQVNCPIYGRVLCKTSSGSDVPCKVRDVLTESNVEAFTLAAPDAPNLTALSAAMDPDQRVHDFFSAGTGAGIYVHSKAAIFAFLTNGEFRATIGSANLFERSVGAPLRDAEANVFWTSDKVGDFWRDLWKEHGGASVTGVPTLADMKQKFHDLGWENLKALLKGRWPGPSNTRMIRLDVVQRCVRAGLC